MKNLNDIFELSKTVGGNGGREFKTIENGAVISKINFFYNSVTLRGIELTFSNKVKHAFGSLVEESCSLNLENKDIAELKAYYSNFGGGRCKGVYIKTKDGNEFIAGNTSNEFISINNCKLVGVIGRSGADIDALGFVYLNTKNIPDINILKKFKF